MTMKPITLTPERARRAILERTWPEAGRVEGNLFLEDEMTLTALPRGLRVDGELFVSDCHRLRRLPAELSARSLFIERCAGLEGFHASCRSFEAQEHLHFSGCPALHAFPEHLAVGKDLTIEDCPRLWDGPVNGIPKSLAVGGMAWLSGCDRLTGLPERTEVGASLEVRDCHRFKALPAGLSAGGVHVTGCAAFEGFDRSHWGGSHCQGGDLLFAGCPALERFPKTLVVGGNFRMTNCGRAWADPALDGGLPDELRIGGRATLLDCQGMTRLPQRMEVGTELDLIGCASLVAIGGGAEGQPPAVGWSCWISDCHGLQRVDALSFKSNGELTIAGCAVLEAIGDGVAPQASLTADNCPHLARLPSRLSLTEGLVLHNCPSLSQPIPSAGGRRLTRSGSTPKRPGDPSP